MSRRSFRLAAAAVSLCAVGALSLGTPAFADPGDATSVGGTNQQAVNPALINKDATVRLSIHKYLGTPTDLPHDGTEQTVTGLPALEGVNFDVYKVEGVDLTTNEGWVAANALYNYKITAADIANGSVTVGGVQYQLTLAETVTTNGTGTATFTEPNGVGLYLVNENVATSGPITNVTTGAVVEKGSITPAPAFLVTLPMTQPGTLASWMYDVNVYPKNQSDAITKTVMDEATYTIGEPIQYTLESSIPGITPLGYYYIQDFNNYVDFSEVTLTAGGTALTGCDGTLAGTGSCDYFYWLDSDATAAGSQLKISFTEAGLTKLETAAKTGGKVTTVIDGTVSAVPDAGVVPNKGSFIPSKSWYDANGGTTPVTPPVVTPGTPPTEPTPDNPGVPSNEVKTYFGNITVDKTLLNATAEDTAVGAEFGVWVDPTPATDCTANDVTGDPLMTKAITEGASVTFSPLRASNWANNVEVTSADAGYIQYCVVETKAPVGYNLNAEPFEAIIDWATGTTTLTRTATVAVSDEKTNLGNSLPLTGGEGTAALSLAGLALIAGGAGYYAYTSRKRREA